MHRDLLSRRALLPPRGLLALLTLAASACAHGPSRDQQTAEIHYNLGLEALRAGHAQEALKEYDEALALDEPFADAHLGRGLVLELAFGKVDQAEREYRRAIQLRAGYSEAHNDLGQLLAKSGRLEEAVREFDAALANMLYKEPWVARCNRGLALDRLGRREEGIAELRACLATNRRYCAGHREIGRIFLSESKVKEALEELGEYARLCGQFADAHYQLGLARLKSGDAERAREAFERCEKLDSESALGAECRRSRELLQ